MANILIVEDDFLSFELAGELLKPAGHSIAWAKDDELCLQEINKQKPDLILMDIELPTLDGYILTSVLKKTPETKDIPVVAFTAKVMQSDIQEAFKAGCSGFIPKPIDISTFVSTVESFITQKNKSHNILAIDDNIMNAEILKDALESVDQNVTLAFNGQQALKKIEKNKYDLILLDIMMPDINGFDLIKILKENPQTADIPVVFISALDSTNDIVKGLNLGSHQYIVKPYKVAELKARVLSILKIRDLQLEIEKQKETFVATLTHDLKTPVRAQIKAAQMLLEGKLGELKDTQVEIVTEILNSNKYMAAMLDNLLYTYKYENGNITLNRMDLDINNLISSCYKEIQHLADDKKQSITLNFDEKALNIQADFIEIKRVIMNLLYNAINYTQENGKILVSTSKQYNNALITFVDNGRGMSQDELSCLFKKFTNYAKKFKQVGTGLGLYLSKQIIEMHEGTISAKSEEGKGSCFTITLPIRSQQLLDESLEYHD